MESIANFWVKLFFIAFASSFMGFTFAVSLGWNKLGCLLTGGAAVAVLFGTFLLGAVGTVHALERAETQHIRDEQESVIVTLCFGPFKYSRAIPLVEKHN